MGEYDNYRMNQTIAQVLEEQGNAHKLLAEAKTQDDLKKRKEATKDAKDLPIDGVWLKVPKDCLELKTEDTTHMAVSLYVKQAFRFEDESVLRYLKHIEALQLTGLARARYRHTPARCNHYSSR